VGWDDFGQHQTTDIPDKLRRQDRHVKQERHRRPDSPELVVEIALVEIISACHAESAMPMIRAVDGLIRPDAVNLNWTVRLDTRSGMFPTPRATTRTRAIIGGSNSQAGYA
jgi:hypothetical protein